MEYFCQMEWSREQIMMMIEMYKKRTALWDNECTDRVKKNNAWDEIAQKFQTNRAEVQYKMRKLVGQFHRERKKMEREGVKIRWFAFEPLRFLMDKEPERSRLEHSASSSTVEDNIQDYQPHLKEEDLSDEAENDICSIGDSPPTMSQPILTMRRQYIPASSEHTYSEPTVKRFKVDKGGKDEFDVFGEYIASQLRKFREPRNRAMAKLRINQVIFDLEMAEVDRSHSKVSADMRASSTFSHEDSYSSTH